jgi:hypothetical protein
VLQQLLRITDLHFTTQLVPQHAAPAVAVLQQLLRITDLLRTHTNERPGATLLFFLLFFY